MHKHVSSCKVSNLARVRVLGRDATRLGRGRHDDQMALEDSIPTLDYLSITGALLVHTCCVSDENQGHLHRRVSTQLS